MFILQAQKNKLSVVQSELLTSGSVNTYTARFSFSNDWGGLDKVAVFRYGSGMWTVILDDTNECAIPWESLTRFSGVLYAGVYGTKGGDIVLPTIWAPLGTVREGVNTDATPSSPPTPGMYDQILQKLHEKGDNLFFEDSTLYLRSGEDNVSSVTIPGSGDFEFATDEEVDQMLKEVFGS